MPEQLVCAVDQIDVQGAAPTPPYRSGLAQSTDRQTAQIWTEFSSWHALHASVEMQPPNAWLLWPKSASPLPSVRIRTEPLAAAGNEVRSQEDSTGRGGIPRRHSRQSESCFPQQNDFGNQFVAHHRLTMLEIANCALVSPLFEVCWRIRLTHASASFQ